jgi:hypothetical protein
MGHNFWLKHWEHAGPRRTITTRPTVTAAELPSSGVPRHHRPGTYTPRFCGQCNLKLRGWDIDAAGIPAD